MMEYSAARSVQKSPPSTGRRPGPSRVKILDVELNASSEPLEDLDGYEALWVLVRLNGDPVGHVEIPLLPGTLYTTADLRRIILRRLAWPILRRHLLNHIESSTLPENTNFGELLESGIFTDDGKGSDGLPIITVAVCTRDRTEDLKSCLDALVRLDYPHLDLLVVDNAPSSDATVRLVSNSYPQVRYVRESRPGLNWARNRAIAEAYGEIIAYTDDDVVVEPGWATALAAAFEDPQVAAVTGLIIPHELETEAQNLFETYGGFGRGFQRKYWRRDCESGERLFKYLGAGQYGTGANMAYRISLFERIGDFDPALDVGTVTNGGGDLEMFFRVVKEGFLLAYEPAAMVRHLHRRGYAQLRTQLTNNGIGFYSYLVRTGLTYPDARVDAALFGLYWFWRWSLRRLIKSYIRPPRIPRDLIWAELWGSFSGLVRYPKARRHAAQILSSGDGEQILEPARRPVQESVAKKEATVGVRTVDLHQPLKGLDDVADHAGVRVFVTFDGRPVGKVDLVNHHQPVGATRLREAILDQFSVDLLEQDSGLSSYTLWENALSELRRRYLPTTDGLTNKPASLPEDVSVSIVVATHDRPDDLRRCLRTLTAQESRRPIEVLVVDNNPASGLTSAVVADFPDVTLITEKRQGLSYARNRGFTESRGEIVVATDDDVSVPSDWLEKLVAPFVWPDVTIVTGNTLPFGLETPAQRRFEKYGGLGRGFVTKEADSEWFESFKRRAVPTWELGATANAAFRASIFAHPEIGLLEETLGAGTPTGCSEDTYIFYKVLQAGYTIVYEPSAYVWHKHRRDIRSFRNQIYNYSKGHVAYHLITGLRDRDPRAAMELAVRLPRWHLKQLARYVKRFLLRRERYPLGLIFIEIRGNLAGPWSLLRSRLRVKREGRSEPYNVVPRRSITKKISS